MMNDLTLYQQAAIQIVRNRALNLRSAAQREIDAVLKRQALDRGLLEHLSLTRARRARRKHVQFPYPKDLQSLSDSREACSRHRRSYTSRYSRVHRFWTQRDAYSA